MSNERVRHFDPVQFNRLGILRKETSVPTKKQENRQRPLSPDYIPDFGAPKFDSDSLTEQAAILIARITVDQHLFQVISSRIINSIHFPLEHYANKMFELGKNIQTILLGLITENNTEQEKAQKASFILDLILVYNLYCQRVFNYCVATKLEFELEESEIKQINAMEQPLVPLFKTIKLAPKDRIIFLLQKWIIIESLVADLIAFPTTLKFELQELAIVIDQNYIGITTLMQIQSIDSDLKANQLTIRTVKSLLHIFSKLELPIPNKILDEFGSSLVLF